LDTGKIISNSRKLKFGKGGDASPTQVGSGMAFPVADLIQTFKPEVWEDFTEEWAYSQEALRRTMGLRAMQTVCLRVEADAGLGGVGQNHLPLI
jgi:hypothetical protein